MGARFTKCRCLVSDKPKWGSLPTKVLGCESEVATLRCHFLGNPTPTMKWFEEKTSLKNITNANDTEVLTPVTSTTAILTPIVAKNVTTFYQESRNSFGSKLEKMEISSSNEMYDLKQTDGFLDLRVSSKNIRSPFLKHLIEAWGRLYVIATKAGTIRIYEYFTATKHKAICFKSCA